MRKRAPGQGFNEGAAIIGRRMDIGGWIDFGRCGARGRGNRVCSRHLAIERGFRSAQSVLAV